MAEQALGPLQYFGHSLRSYAAVKLRGDFFTVFSLRLGSWVLARSSESRLGSKRSCDESHLGNGYGLTSSRRLACRLGAAQNGVAKTFCLFYSILNAVPIYCLIIDQTSLSLLPLGSCRPESRGLESQLGSCPWQRIHLI